MRKKEEDSKVKVPPSNVNVCVWVCVGEGVFSVIGYSILF